MKKLSMKIHWPNTSKFIIQNLKVRRQQPFANNYNQMRLLACRSLHIFTPAVTSSISHHQNTSLRFTKSLGQSSSIFENFKTTFKLNKVSVRNLFLSSTMSYWHVSKEVDWAFNYLKSNPRYEDLIFNPSAHPVTHQSAQQFIDLSLSNPDEPISDVKYEAQVQQMLSSLKEFTDSELLQIMRHWTHFPRPKSHKVEAFAKIWKVVDEECIQRAVARKNWRSDVNFLFAELWYRLGLSVVSPFHWLLVKQCIRKVDSLSREKFVRACLCLCQVRSIPDEISLYDFEYNIPRILKSASEDEDQPKMSVDEISIICFAFYKTKNPIRNKNLVGDILEIVAEDSRTISSSTLVPIIKALRLSHQRGIEDKIDKFLTSFTPEIPGLNLTAVSALADMGVRSNIRNVELLEAIAQKVKEQLGKDNTKQKVVKDMEWLSSGFAMLCNNPTTKSAVLEEIVQITREAVIPQNTITKSESDDDKSDEEIKKFEEERVGMQLKKYARSLVYILNNLAIADVYPLDLISVALSKNFMDQFYGAKMFVYKPELLYLDQNVLIERKDYAGPQLSDKSRCYLLKKHMEWVEPPSREKVSFYQTFCRAVHKEMLTLMGDNSEFLHLCNILPHHRNIEAVFCTNESNELIPVPESFKTKPIYLPKILNKEDLTGINYHVVLMYMRERCMYNLNELDGQGKMQRRQIESLGYHTYVVFQPEWKNHVFQKTQDEYLCSVLDGAFSFKLSNSQTSKDNLISSKTISSKQL